MATRFSWAHKCYPAKLRSEVNCFLYYKIFIFFKAYSISNPSQWLFSCIVHLDLFVWSYQEIFCLSFVAHKFRNIRFFEPPPHLNVVQNLFLQGHLSSTVGSKKQDCVYFILKHPHMLSQPPTHKTTTNIGQVHVCMPWPWEQCRACLYEALRHGICGI